MPDDRDHYESYYADKLWSLLPAMYRAEDSEVFDRNGPLRELVNRIGAQAAIVRRSIDRMWEDQSIETCDDWVVPYIADLLSTNLVSSLNARGQRLDVAKTIYYRRRKGTVALLEELAQDITGWEVRVVEFFRRLGRTRHGLDPEIGFPAASPAPLDARTLQLAEGLTGQLTNTCIGGWADLRNVYGALQAQSPFGVYDKPKPPSAFEEYFHTADFRRSRGRAGWYDIPHIGFFLWRLYSFPLTAQEPDTLLTKPVQNANPLCANHYSFDPTGREIPLFATSESQGNRFGNRWVSPEEWQLPIPISKTLLDLDKSKKLDKEHDAPNRTNELYVVSNGILQMNSVGVFRNDTNTLLSFDDSSGDASINPERGTLTVNNPAASDPQSLRVWYHYGFASTIGAGVYGRRVAGKKLADLPAPFNSVNGGGNVPLPGAIGTLTIKDSLTYDTASDVGSAGAEITNVTIWANSEETRTRGHSTRPLIRLGAPQTEWIFTGADGSNLHLEGLFVSGGDIVLKGKFDRVTISCCTLDPGNSGESADPPTVFAKSIDQRDLVNSTLWIEAQINELEIDRSIVGPLRTRGAGAVEALTITDSIVQSIRTAELGSPGVPEDKALEFNIGTVHLIRTTVIGPAHVHRLEASECILDGVFMVDDCQHGCVRFSAWSTGSVLPRRYESVEVAANSPLFTSRVFGQPGYAQLVETVDSVILPGQPNTTIAGGAEDGSEMGVFAREKNPIKERSLRIKYEEFMPIGLVPVIVHVT